MKTNVLQFFMLICMTFNCHQSFAQPNEWSFYLAFEDATGQTDTIWRVWHDDAHYTELEPELGEMPYDLSPDFFNVWEYILNMEDHYNTVVQQFNGSSDFYIYANNYTLPITVTWDTSLFEADILIQELGNGILSAFISGEYFGFDQVFSMLETDHVELPFFGPASHFPMFVSLSINGSGVSVRDIYDFPVSLHPNPVVNILHISTPENIRSIEIRDLNGKQVLAHPQGGGGNEKSVDVSGLPAGMYFLLVTGDKGRSVGKFVKW